MLLIGPNMRTLQEVADLLHETMTNKSLLLVKYQETLSSSPADDTIKLALTALVEMLQINLEELNNISTDINALVRAQHA